MNIRAKMQCFAVTRMAGEQETVVLTAVHGDSEENKTFSRWTPAAKLEMSVTNPAALGAFVPGEEYYVDFKPAKKE